MLRALKWAYDLGVKQERQRIARYLEGQVSALGNEIGVARDMFNDLPNSAKTRKQKLQFKIAVANRVQDIIYKVLRPNYSEAPTTSFMFPDGKEEK